MTRRLIIGLAAVLAVGACSDQNPTGNLPGSELASTSGNIGINVILKAPATAANRTELAKYSTLLDEIAELNAIRVRAKADQLPAIQALPFVKAASPDAVRDARPIDAVSVSDFANGISTWDQDAVNVTNFGAGRTIGFDGTGVYVAILDTGLLPTWRQYFPQERIAIQFAKSFGGGGQDQGNVSEQPNKWEQDVNSHGTHVTSTVLGFQIAPTFRVNGTAPLATIIPVKVLNQNGSGWSSVIARGILYIRDLKLGALANTPVVINMSLGGPSLDALEQAAIDAAVQAGVVIVASAGNSGPTGAMGFPGAYQPVISVASAGYVREWEGSNSWWRNSVSNTADPTDPAQYYISEFSSLRTGTQDLDVAAPGSWVVGPYQLNQSNRTSFFFLGGTSMASPHVAGIVALMLQKNPTLGVAPSARAAEAEQILTSSATPIPYIGQTVRPRPGASPQAITSWTTDRSGSGLATADEALAATP
ncbi:MAG: S8 family serine peptidase [Gemmatimonadales bacterium]